MRLVPPWLASYRRDWLVPDLVAGLVVWSVVVPQSVAYAQVAGLPPEAGLIAAPGALIGYALLGTSRSLVVGATTATAAVSAAAVGPLADGDAMRYAALSAGLALVAAAVFVAAGLLRLGAVFDFVSPPVMTGFLFGLGLTIAVGQAAKLLGVEAPGGGFFEKVWELVRDLGDASGWTVATGVLSIAALLAVSRLAPGLPATLVVLGGAILVSTLLDLSGRGVDVVGELPDALPDPGVPDVSWNDLVDLVAPAFGVLFVSAEAVGVARSLGVRHRYAIDTNRELIGLGGANLLSALSQGFVQSGGSSQTAAADRAGGKTQLASLVAAGLVLLTGAFLAPLFENLPQATLAAIVVVAVSGFWRVGELRRFALIRPSALFQALVALGGVLVLGVLPGLIVAAALSLILVVRRLSRPSVGVLARDPQSGAWGRADRHPDWTTPPDLVVGRVDGPIFYANSSLVKERLLELAAGEPPPRAVVLSLEGNYDLDLASVDAFAELADALAARGSELRLAAVHVGALNIIRRSGLNERVRIEPTIDAAADAR